MPDVSLLPDGWNPSVSDPFSFSFALLIKGLSPAFLTGVVDAFAKGQFPLTQSKSVWLKRSGGVLSVVDNVSCLGRLTSDQNFIRDQIACLRGVHPDGKHFFGVVPVNDDLNTKLDVVTALANFLQNGRGSA